MSDGEKVDISNIRPGDKVTLVPLGVKRVLHDRRLIQIPDNGGTAVYFDIDLIAAHHPAPREFQVGDRVKSGSLYFGTVRAVDGHEAWVRWDGHDANWSAEIQALTLVEAGQ